MFTAEDLRVRTLGPCGVSSPLAAGFVPDTARIRCDLEVGSAGEGLSFEKAGPRERLHFDPAGTTAAIVTCGGLSPGLNNVIRSAYMELRHNYGVARVLGVLDGYQGLNPAEGRAPLELTHELVEPIHHQGGTLLGSSRGPQEPAVMADFLEAQDIDVLFCVGGDGTQRGAHALGEEIQKRGLRKAIVGIPKTIDNDIPFVQMSFGFATALERAEDALRGAHVEATSAPNGVGLVKLMGRDAGFITAGASVVSQEANFVLVPEVPFPLEGEDGFLAALERRIVERGHALVAVAEGAGQHLFERDDANRDASGNVRYGDIGVYLCDRIVEHFAAHDVAVNLKYIDPSYMIRACPANAWDRYLSDQMARHAVHAAMAGKTDVLTGFLHQEMIYVPIPVAVSEKKQMELASPLWQAVLATTKQPCW